MDIMQQKGINLKYVACVNYFLSIDYLCHSGKNKEQIF